MSIPVLIAISILSGLLFLVGLIMAVVFLATGKNRNALISGVSSLAMAAATILCIGEAIDRTVDTMNNVKENFEEGIKDLMDSIEVEKRRNDSIPDSLQIKDREI